jgi:hypothetical protein
MKAGTGRRPLKARPDATETRWTTARAGFKCVQSHGLPGDIQMLS